MLAHHRNRLRQNKIAREGGYREALLPNRLSGQPEVDAGSGEAAALFNIVVRYGSTAAEDEVKVPVSYQEPTPLLRLSQLTVQCRELHRPLGLNEQSSRHRYPGSCLVSYP
jgi:hypothetical protein